MDVLKEIFPIIIYLLSSILLIVLIVLMMKLINTVDKTNEILDDVDKKVKSLDGIFNTIDVVSVTLSRVGDKIFDAIFNFIGKFGKSKKKKRKEEDIDE